MGVTQVVEATRDLSEDEKTEAAIQITKNLTPAGQQKVAREGIDKSAWPQESRDRRITILGALVIAVILVGFALVAASLKSQELVTGILLLASGIVGGIFGYSTQAK